MNFLKITTMYYSLPYSFSIKYTFDKFYPTHSLVYSSCEKPIVDDWSIEMIDNLCGGLESNSKIEFMNGLQKII